MPGPGQPPALTTKASTQTIIGTYENDSGQDIFQVLQKGGAVECGMNASGVIYNTVGGLLVSVAPIVANVIITAAQLKAASSTAVVVVSSPGPGLLLIPVSISAIFEYVAPNYSDTFTDNNLYVGYGSTPSSVISNSVLSNANYGDLMTNSESRLATFTENLGGGVAVANAVNQPLSFALNDVLTLGNGKLQIDLAFNIVPATF